MALQGGQEFGGGVVGGHGADLFNLFLEIALARIRGRDDVCRRKVAEKRNEGVGCGGAVQQDISRFDVAVDAVGGVEEREAVDQIDSQVRPFRNANDGVEHGLGRKVVARCRASCLSASFQAQWDGAENQTVLGSIITIKGNQIIGCLGKRMQVGQDAGFLFQYFVGIATRRRFDRQHAMDAGLRGT